MIVVVNIDISKKPDREYLNILRWTAEKLTNDRKSVSVSVYERRDFHRLETRFAMRTTAQYTVVDQIFHDFEFASENYDEFLDISVSFQK